ncbi:hypothetical protein FHW79_006075 [Azospirillum sp. OGB3]|uniref:peptidoglycan-binding domain-containing protein n=1 Tax=Azospirillum sp. OGB3 TaxID=2587012 RepID=UPI00160660BD|nr:peptidoglycan-binding domain-containing protein [Azospirillum sp. OGB3]MBB3268400.1 hypothetical protein [Azospirillum sp. OGB3]
MILLRLIVFALAAAAGLALMNGDAAVEGVLLRWSGTVTTVLNVLMLVGLVVGFAVATAVAAERGWIDSPLLARFAATIRRLGYRLLPPVNDRYTEAAAVADLETLGYPVDVAGLGVITRGSVKRFQRDRGLTATGWLDPLTVKTLTAAARARSAPVASGEAAADPDPVRGRP